MVLPPQVYAALTRLKEAGFKAFLVGGAVRDSLLGKNPASDWDIATSARPEQVQEVFSGCRLIETGLQHGTVTVLLQGLSLEITTFRTGHPVSAETEAPAAAFSNHLAEDLAHRDFTVNALAYHPKTGLIDLHDGRKDLLSGLVRCVGAPKDRFREDGLRILRAIRFASVFGMQIEEKTAQAMRQHQALLQGVAAERIQTELTQILCGREAARLLREFAAVIAVVMPEIRPMFGLEQQNPHHDRDVWEHTLAVLAAAPPDPVLRWAALLHDIGKPACFSISEDGTGHFYGHARKSVETADTILARLRFSAAQKERILQLIRYHDLPLAADKKQLKRLLNRLGVEAVRQLIQLHQADTHGQSAICQYRLSEYEQIGRCLEEILQEEACFSLRDLAVNGHDMLALGLKGKAIGTALAACLDAVMEERLPNDRELLLSFVCEKLQKNPAAF